MKWFVFLSALASSPTLAQGGSYKLILIANNSTVAIDYPTLARCTAAKVEAEAEAKRRFEVQTRINGGIQMDAPLRLIAFCIPG